MKIIATVICVTASCIALSAEAFDSGTIQLKSKGRIQHIQATYDCGPAGRLAVTYVNADPNFLALVPVPGQSQPLLFASVIAGSGARYAAGKYIWWTKGNSASLYDSTLGDNAPPLSTCNATN